MAKEYWANFPLHHSFQMKKGIVPISFSIQKRYTEKKKFRTLKRSV